MLKNNRQWNHLHITEPTQRQQCPFPPPQSGDDGRMRNGQFRRDGTSFLECPDTVGLADRNGIQPVKAGAT